MKRYTDVVVYSLHKNRLTKKVTSIEVTRSTCGTFQRDIIQCLQGYCRYFGVESPIERLNLNRYEVNAPQYRIIAKVREK